MSFISNPHLTRNGRTPPSTLNAQQTAADPSPKPDDKKPEEKKDAEQPKKASSIA